MKSVLLFAATSILFSLSAQAFEEGGKAEISTMVPTMVIGGTTYAAGAVLGGATMAVILGPLFTTEDSRYNKMIVMEAKDDAVMALASNGEVVGASLVRAIQVVRAASPNASFTDMEIVAAIIAY